MTEKQPDQTDQSSESADGRATDAEDARLDSGEPGEVSDAELPEDLRPTEDNPLARHPEQTGDEDDAIGADTEGEPQTAPLHESQADYGSGGQDGADGADSQGGDGPQDGRVGAEESDGSEDLENGGGGAG